MQLPTQRAAIALVWSTLFKTPCFVRRADTKAHVLGKGLQSPLFFMQKYLLYSMSRGSQFLPNLAGAKLEDSTYGFASQGADPPPHPLRVAKAGRKHLNEEFTLRLPTGIGERCSQTISNLGHGALLRQCELPLFKRNC